MCKAAKTQSKVLQSILHEYGAATGQSINLNFWWSSGNKSGKIHWQSWKKLCIPKEKGGLGFRDIECFNQALLAKQAWRILQEPESLLARVMKSRYFERSEFLSASVGSRPSYGWRSIIHGRSLLRQGLSKQIGNGKSVRVWTDLWIEDEGLRSPWRKNYFFDVNLKVSDLLDGRKRDWDLQKLEDNFFPGDIVRVKKIRSVVLQNDFYIWKHNKNGDFSVKSAYWLAYHNTINPSIVAASMCPSVNVLKDKVWSLQTDPKIKIFLWKALSDSLPVAVALSGRGIRMDKVCQICGTGEESINHILFNCSLSRQIWALSGYPSPEFGFQEGSVFSNMYHLLLSYSNQNWPKDLRRSFPWILWRIWTNRNLILFEGKSFSALEVVEKIKDDVNEWFEAQEVVSAEGEDGENIPNFLVHGQKKDENGWKTPQLNWIKCNIGTAWSKRNKMAGGAWVVRDAKGLVLLHSRKSFINIGDKMEAQMLVMFWVIESMKSHKLDNVVFALQANELVGAVNRPKSWPSLRYQSSEIIERLRDFLKWKMVVETNFQIEV